LGAAFGLLESTGHLSIHSADSIQFATEVLNAGRWHLQLSTNGLSLSFTTEPGQYHELIDRSALVNREVVDNKLVEWIWDGHLSEVSSKPTCCIPI